MSDNQKHPRGGFSHHSLRVWHEALRLVQVVHSHRIDDAELRNQSMRASRSVALNIAEGSALCGGNRRRHFSIARGSVVETVAAYELAEAIGEKVPVCEVRRLGAAISSMLFGLVR